MVGLANGIFYLLNYDRNRSQVRVIASTDSSLWSTELMALFIAFARLSSSLRGFCLIVSDCGGGLSKSGFLCRYQSCVILFTTFLWSVERCLSICCHMICVIQKVVLLLDYPKVFYWLRDWDDYTISRDIACLFSWWCYRLLLVWLRSVSSHWIHVVQLALKWLHLPV